MFIKRPGKGRSSYALIDNNNKTIKDPRIDAVNADLRSGVARDILEQRMKAIMRSYSPKEEAPLLLAANERLVETRHQAKMLRKPGLANPEGLKMRLISAVRTLGEVSLESASEDEILVVTSKIKDPARRHEVLRGLNELLKYLGRPLLPNPAPPQSSRAAFIEIHAFNEKRLSLPVEAQIVLGALFATGCRWGELALAEPNAGKVPSAHIAEQLDRHGNVRRTKNKRERDSIVLAALLNYWERYQELPQLTKNDIRVNKYNHYYRLCKLKLGIRIHDLRHSYAIALRKAGISTSSIAEMIGDTEEVCRKRYLRHGLTEDEFAAMWKKLGG